MYSVRAHLRSEDPLKYGLQGVVGKRLRQHVTASFFQRGSAGIAACDFEATKVCPARALPTPLASNLLCREDI